MKTGEPLINCLTYIDLNLVRAGLVERLEDYRWKSIGYHIQSKNKDYFLSLDFGLREFGVQGTKERLRRYRRFLHETGAKDWEKGAQLDPGMVEREPKNGYRLTRTGRFSLRIRYLTDSGIICDGMGLNLVL